LLFVVFILHHQFLKHLRLFNSFALRWFGGPHNIWGDRSYYYCFFRSERTRFLGSFGARGVCYVLIVNWATFLHVWNILLVVKSGTKSSLRITYLQFFLHFRRQCKFTTKNIIIWLMTVIGCMIVWHYCSSVHYCFIFSHNEVQRWTLPSFCFSIFSIRKFFFRKWIEVGFVQKLLLFIYFFARWLSLLFESSKV
jgi:hypothetical protein